VHPAGRLARCSSTAPFSEGKPVKPLTEEHLAIFRRHMVEVIDIHFELLGDEIGRSRLGENLRSALLKVPRHLFAPLELAAIAYQDAPLPIGFSKTISQPFIAALMIDLLDVGPEDAVLEVGTGFGYQAAILAELSRHVWSVEVVEEFVEIAQSRMDALGHGNVTLRVGDGARGWPDEGPFDKILVTAATGEVPPRLLEQLRPGGRLVIPLGSEDAQQISLIEMDPDREIRVHGVLPAKFTRLETV
jgi:protein-L-isoaspartate(D-aspartate) O-methyltransferase